MMLRPTTEIDLHADLLGKAKTAAGSVALAADHLRSKIYLLQQFSLRRDANPSRIADMLDEIALDAERLEAAATNGASMITNTRRRLFGD